MHGTGTRKWRTASRCPTDMARWGAGSRPACGAGRTDARMGAGRIKADGCVCRQRTAVKGTWKTTVSDGILSYDTIVFFLFYSHVAGLLSKLTSLIHVVVVNLLY